MKKVVTDDNVRFTVITNDLLRIEEDATGKFEDRATTTVRDRDFGDPEVQVLKNNNGHKLEIITPGFHLYYEGGKLDAESLYADVTKAHSLYQNRWNFGIKGALTSNLKGTARTLDQADGAIPLNDGIMSKDGYAYLDDSKSFLYDQSKDEFVPRTHESVDGYLFTYGRDYQKELQDFYKLTGPTPLIPRYALGNWWSRFYPYKQDQYQKLMEKFEENNIPINVSVIDMDWHKNDDQVPSKYGSAWTGYSWNHDLFPEPEKLLTWLHEHGKKVTLNLHPASGIRAFEDAYPKVAKDLGLNTEAEEPAALDMMNPKFRDAYFKDVHHPLEKQGVDFWWVDWQQGAGMTSKQLDPLWLLNHYHYEDNSARHNGDGLILSRYAGPGSHRYPIGFSGDSIVSWNSLAFQPYFTITASNIGYTWWSHDIGGHMLGSYNGELETRWVQFGVFSPINRLHASNNEFMGKEPWNYRIDYEKSQEKFLRLRDQMLPMIDTANYQTHTNGVPIVKPLYYDYPENEAAYNAKNEYIFASKFLVSPITSPADDKTSYGSVKTWLPEGKWIDYFTHLPYEGNTEIETFRSIDQMPVFVKENSLVVTNPDYMQDVNELPSRLKVEIFGKGDSEYELVEHQGKSIAKTHFIWHADENRLSYNVEDPDQIIPKDRKIEKVIVPMPKEDVIDELKKRLQVAKIKFDTKQDIYNAFIDPDYDFAKFTNLLTNLDDEKLAASMRELAYVRESY